jgi:hypothetical protein
MQLPLQVTSPLGQASWQRPLEQTSPFAQA